MKGIKNNTITNYLNILFNRYYDKIKKIEFLNEKIIKIKELLEIIDSYP